MDIKDKKAAALSYNKEDDAAPKLIAKGKGHLAEQILKIAHDEGILIHEDRALVEILYLLEIYQEIPEDMYRSVAAVFSKLYDIDKKIKN